MTALAIIAVIPVRINSTRFPEKVLANKTGKPLIQHVWEAVSNAPSIKRILIAGDDPKIEDAVKLFGGEYIKTSKDHVNGTSRCHEAFNSLGIKSSALVLNIQGDEPELDPNTIESTITSWIKNDDCPVSTAASPLKNDVDFINPNVVKVVCDDFGRALYFSRSPIPYLHKKKNLIAKRHIGLYAYDSRFLNHFVKTAPSYLEEAEQLEQLRILSMGSKIAVADVKDRSEGIDTPQQYDNFVNRYQRSH